MLQGFDWRRRSRAAGWHLLISAVVAALAAALVFGLWYPGPYRLLSGGTQLFFLVVTVDVILGPLLTFAVFDLAKGWPQLRRDLAVIGAIQLAGLAYGMHTVYVVRPVALVFEVDRFRVVPAADVRLPELPLAAPEYRSLPLTGPWLLGTRESATGDEKLQAIDLALKGFDRGQRPSYWVPYADARDKVIARARPVAALIARYPERAAEIRERLQRAGANEAEARFLPVMARIEACALLDGSARLLGFVSVDGFF